MKNSDFRPLPLLGDPHVQTIVGALLNELQPRISSRRRQVSLPDGDRLLIYDSRPQRWRSGDPIVILVHGLNGCHRSGFLLRLGRLLMRQRLRVVRLDLRGAGNGLCLARRTYNAACSPDVRAAAQEVHTSSPASPLILVGYSLGGNIVLKLAGEAAAEPLPGLYAVAAVNPPIDLLACARSIARPENRFYDNYFVRKLVEHVGRHQRCFPEMPRVEFPKDVTFWQFDELYTAPRGGYTDAEDYYRRASALPLMERIQVATLILTARDDPFVDVEPIAALPTSSLREVRIAGQGGHLGFVGWNGNGSIRWAEQAIADWISSIVPPRK